MGHYKKRGLLLAAALVMQTLVASAQPAASGNLFDNARGYTPITIEPGVQDSVGTLTSVSNVVFKPDGAGPFPAVVLLHTCGGIQAHIRQHAQELVASGYVTLVQDSHKSRNMQTCVARPIPFAVGVMDSYAALRHLATLPFVNPARIYMAGYSYGGFVATMLASPQGAAKFESPLRFRATVAHYANCVRPSGARVLMKDVDRPVLMLMGERDTEALSAACFPMLDELKSAGAPVFWHIYPGMTHGWDKQGEAGAGHIYDAAATQDATRRMLAFFDANP
jgi:dienelactone hydrolase